MHRKVRFAGLFKRNFTYILAGKNAGEINVWPHQMSLKFQKVICLLSITCHLFFTCLR